MLVRTAIVTMLFCTLAVAQQRQPNYPPNMPEARVETYKSVDGVDLNVWIFEPDGHQASDNRPAIVFFFGGGFRGGSPGQFRNQAKHLASRGMVAISADYRVLSRHGVKPDKCFEDAKAAVRWIRVNAGRLGIDPDRIAAGGGSAGGYLAVATATLPGHDNPAGDTTISSQPNALALFNPGTVRAPVAGKLEISEERIAQLRARFGPDLISMSPYHQLKADLPPSIIFHGKADTTIPYITVEIFAEKANALGARCELVGYDGEVHGFFNHGRGDGSAYTDTVRRMDDFFVSLGWLAKSQD